jgi:hypothetical protein
MVCGGFEQMQQVIRNQALSCREFGFVAFTKG